LQAVNEYFFNLLEFGGESGIIDYLQRVEKTPVIRPLIK